MTIIFIIIIILLIASNLYWMLVAWDHYDRKRSDSDEWHEAQRRLSKK
jgi:hypothetical protein